MLCLSGFELYSRWVPLIFADQVFIDPTFFGIFVCGPLQSFVVNVCNQKNPFFQRFSTGFDVLTTNTSPLDPVQ